MKKRKSTIIASIAALVAVFGLTACTIPNVSGDGSTGSGGGSDVVPPITTTYVSSVKSSDYAQVDTANYLTYYFDSESGADDNDGLSETTPKATLAAAERIISSVTAESPVHIRFKAGSEYAGTLTVGGFSAAEETPLILDVYDATETEKYVKIVGAENSDSCVYIRAGNLRVSGFELTAPAGKRGFYVSPEKGGALSNLVVSGNYIHDVCFNWTEEKSPEETDPESINVKTVCPDAYYGYQRGGIIFYANTKEYVGPSWFENVWVENNIVERVARSGMFIDSMWTRRPGLNWGYNHYYDDDTGWYPHSNFNVRGNSLSYCGGDSIVMLAVDGGYIENNASMHAQYLARAGFYSAGIWTHSCKNIVIQYNESAYTHLFGGAGDGQGFDIDIGCSNIIFQYNYSHHNEGGSILLCNRSTVERLYDENGDPVFDEDGLPIDRSRLTVWENNVIRNNVFAYDKDVCITSNGAIGSYRFENNTVLVDQTTRYRLLRSGDFAGTGVMGEHWTIDNNIFWFKQQITLNFDASFCYNCTLAGNVFFNADTEFIGEISNNSDYKFIDPGFGNGPTAENGLEKMTAFIATNASVLEAGVPLAEMNAADYAKNSAQTLAHAGYAGAFCAIK